MATSQDHKRILKATKVQTRVVWVPTLLLLWLLLKYLKKTMTEIMRPTVEGMKKTVMFTQVSYMQA